jgi:hypothetical protein
VGRISTALAPRGWRDFGLQVVLLGSFEIVYAVSGLYGRGQARTAVAHARGVIGLERRWGIFWEHGVQNWAMRRHMVMDVANHTYFLSQLGVSSAFLLWAYLRRPEHFERVRNAFLAVNLVSVAVLFAYPLAPPRLVPGAGFSDTMSSSAVNLHSELIDALNNPYSAMPSLHASYALVLGIAGVALSRTLWAKLLWAMYPLLITFSIVASGNHFVLDALGGFAALAVIPLADRVYAAVGGWLAVRRAAARRGSIRGESAA